MALEVDKSDAKKKKCEVQEVRERSLDVCWFLLSDVPPGTVIGLDANIWTVGPNFRGIRDIPFGVHYFFYNSASITPSHSSISGLRCSQFLYLNEPRVIRKRWVNEREEFQDQLDGNIDAILSNKVELNAYLGAYPRDRFANWIALASHITPDTIERLVPSGGWIYSCAQFQSEKSNTKDRANLPIPPHLKRGDEADIGVCPPESIEKGDLLLPVLKTVPETDIHWTAIPQHPLFPPGSTSAEISQHNIDQTYTLNHLIAQLDTWNSENGQKDSELDTRPTSLSRGESRLLAEFHFAFVIFLLGEVLDGWFHWRRILAVIANCEKAVRERPIFYKTLITSLYRLFTYSDENEKPEETSTRDSSLNDGSVRVAGLFQAGNEENGGFAFFDGWKNCDVDEPAFLPHTMMRLFGNIAGAAETADRKNHQVKDVLERAEGLRICLERRFDVKLTPHRPQSARDDGEIPVDEVNWDTDEAPVIVMD
nr:AAR2 [Hymenolepis microstoma]